jgi:hypothetical protein
MVMSSPYQPVDPMMMYHSTDNVNYINIRLNEGARPQQAIQQMEGIFKQHNPAYPFEYELWTIRSTRSFNRSADQQDHQHFRPCAHIYLLHRLAGLASFTIENGIREIGIRKVLGATVQQLLLLISKEFLKLVFIAFMMRCRLPGGDVQLAAEVSVSCGYRRRTFFAGRRCYSAVDPGCGKPQYHACSHHEPGKEPAHGIDSMGFEKIKIFLRLYTRWDNKIFLMFIQLICNGKF